MRELIGRVARRLSAQRTLITGLGLSVIAAAVVVVAVRAEGSVASNVRLDDGSVWVTNERSGRVGRLNVRIDELDLAVAGRAETLLQEDRAVVYDGPGGTAQKVDVVSVQIRGNDDLPAALYQMGGGIGLVLDATSGGVWVGSSAALVGSSYPDEPDGLVEPGSRAIVTRGDGGGEGGAVFVFDERGWYRLAVDEQLQLVRAVAVGSDSTTSTLAPDADDDDEAPEPLPAPDYQILPGEFGDIETLSSVGSIPVMLLRGGRVSVGGAASVSIPGDGVVLQQPGPTADGVIVASSAGLFELGLDAVSPMQIAAASAPAGAPVRVGPCIYGGWSGDEPSVFKRCGAADVRFDGPLPNAVPNSPVVFRVNGRNVAVNQPVDGKVWADHDGELAEVGNWDQVEPRSGDESDADQPAEGERTTDRVCIDGRAETPIAGADPEVGARPRQTILDVLNNDDDANCEPIAVVQVDPPSGEWGELTIVDDGQHVLYTPSDDMARAASERIEFFEFEYVVADAAGNRSAPAAVNVQVKARDVGDSPPELRPRTDGSTRTMVTEVEEGRAIGYNVLADWWDPDGDELRVADAEAEDIGEVSATADGTVRYAAYGVGPGVQRVQVRITDGRLEATEPLEVTIQPTGSALAPVTADDFITLLEGTAAIIAPLSNDSDPNEDRLELRPLWETDEAASNGVTARLEDDGVRIEANSTGTYALAYEAFDGEESTGATILVNVLGPSTDNAAPVAVPDTVRVRAGRVVNVDVLANDVDEDGDLLAVTEVRSNAGERGGVRLQASVVDRRLIQLEVLPGSSGVVTERTSFTLDYTVADGFEDVRAGDPGQTVAESTSDALRASGTVTVLVEPTALDQPPIPRRDRATVRSGDVVSVPVLRNDSDPDGDQILLKSVDEEQAEALEASGGGVVWAEGRKVWFQGGTPGQVSVLYTIEAGGREATSEVNFIVVGPVSADNQNNPPAPPDLQLRAIRDGRVRLQIPLTGVDADGDSVVLMDEFSGNDSANKITVDPENPDTVYFEASASSPPRDRFTYRVRDGFGVEGVGTVEVVVINDSGAPPSANDDVLRGRPGRTLSVPVLANDTSPQDRPLSLAKLPFFDVDGVAVATPTNIESVTVLDQTEAVSRGRIDVVVPTDDGLTLSEHYRITDGPNDASAFIRITPDPETPNRPPIANDDVVDDAEVQDVTEVPVDVLSNDRDPDDVGGDLKLSVAANQRAVVLGNEIVAEVDERARTVIYRIEDTDGGIGVGRIFIPGAENHPPVLTDDGKNRDLRIIDAGTTDDMAFNLSVIVEDPDGDPDIRLTDTEVRTLESIGDVARRDDGSGFDYTPPPQSPTTEVIRIEFEVTDRPDQSLAEQLLPTCNCRSTLIVELEIRASTPPRIPADGSVSVPQLDEPVTFDLAKLAIDDEDDPLTFELSPENNLAGLEVTQNGSELTLVSRVGGDERLPLGRQIPIFFTVTDDNFEPVTGRLNVTIIATNKGRPAAGSFAVLEAERDESLQLPNLLDSASNPFPDRPLVVATRNVDKGAGLTCDELGNCTFTTATVGTFTVSYTLEDAVGQIAPGTIIVVAKGKPRAPGVPRIESVGDKHVNLTWDAADPQGADISGYAVTAEGTGQTKRFPSTGGRFDGLTNATPYRFSVIAINEVGEGERSGVSSIGIPDRVPSPPEGLTFSDYGDARLRMEWAPPSDSGDYSAIQDYEVTIGGQVLTTGGATSLDVELLTNGTLYTFDVRAKNLAVTDGGWGAKARSVVREKPSRFPDQPTAVSASNTGDGGTPRLTVTWLAPGFDGGREIANYEVCRTGVECQNVGTSTSATFDVVRNTDSQFVVRAFNTDKNRDVSDASESSAAVRAIGNPDAPSFAGSSSNDKVIVVAASGTNGSGCSSQNIEYSINNGTNWQASGAFAGLTNGTTYTVITRAVLPVGCGGTPGRVYASTAPYASTSETPLGPLQQPTMSAVVSGPNVVWTWSTHRRSDDGRGSNWSAELTGPCGTSVAAGTATVNVGYLTEPPPCALTVSAPGASSLTASATATTSNPPRWDITVRWLWTWIRGSSTGSCGGGTQARNPWTIDGRDWPEGGTAEFIDVPWGSLPRIIGGLTHTGVPGLEPQVVFVFYAQYGSTSPGTIEYTARGNPTSIGGGCIGDIRYSVTMDY